MNIDPKALGKYEKDLKAALTAKKPSDKVKRLIALHSNRIDDGVRRGLQNARAYYAIDRAYDVSQHQITPTLVRDLIDRNPSVEQVQSLVKGWGLEGMLTHVPDTAKFTGIKGGKAKPGYILQAPTFFTIFVPLLLSYTKIRWAKLFNDRDFHPLYKYEPLVFGTKDRAAAKVVTGRIQRMSSDMNARAVERDSIQKMLLYGECINFPMESWYTEKQKIGGKEKIVKEGVRFALPHPTRTFRDMSHPAYTLNSDTGCEWGGYWGMQKYGDIISNPKYWIPEAKDGKGKDGEFQIPTGWRGDDAYTNLYSIFYPCVIKFPAVSGGSISPNDRQKSNFVYNADTLDMGIDVTVFFHKLNPKEWGLYDYDYPVWHRFVYAGNQRVLYCEPIFYSPMVAYLYDYDAERSRNSSLGFELLPFQDHMGNLLSQHLLTVKKNLMRIVAVNQDIVGNDFVNKAANFAENSLRGLELFFYSGQELKDQGTDIGAAFQPIALQQQSTQETISAITNLVNILERLLGYSAQEVGSSASHQQSAAEVNIISGASSTRMNFTGGFVDDAIYARKKLLYYAMMHYSSDDIFVEVSDMTPGGQKALKELGFTLTVNDNDPGVMTVKGSKKSLVFDSVLSERDGASRGNDQQTAQLLMAFLDRLMANPRVGETIPLKVVFKFWNAIADYMGIPTDIKLPEDIDTQNQEAQQQQLQQLQQAVTQMITQQVGPAVDKLSQEVAKNAQETEQALTEVAKQGQATGQGLAQVAQKQQTDEQALMMLMQKFDQFLERVMQPQQMGVPPIPQQMAGPVMQ